MFARIIGFLIAKPIRYLALKVMKAMRQPDDMRPVIAVADHLVGDIVLPSVYAIFQDAQFRERARFQKLTSAEHDRIFNELHVAGVCLAMCCLEVAHTIVQPEYLHFWTKAREYLPRQVQQSLVKFGVDGANAKLFRQLIDMRFEEYEHWANEVWDMWSEEEPRFRSMPEGMKRVISRVDAIAIGTTDHILRGKDDAGGHLARCLRAWLHPLNENIGRFIKKL